MLVNDFDDASAARRRRSGETGPSAGNPSAGTPPAESDSRSIDAAETLGDAGDLFLRRVRRAATTVLADSQAGREVLELCDEHAEARRLVLDDRSAGATVVAIVGATGQGKSWLIRQLIRGSSAATAVRSGNRGEDVTENLIWIGPRPPADLDPRHERFLHCEASKMQDIGVPYVLVDAPGATDDRRGIAAVAARALSLASVLLVVVRRDQIRSQAVGALIEAGEGTLVIPVINAIRGRDTALQTDVDALRARLREAAPTSIIAPPVMIDDFEVDGRNEASVGAEAAESVAALMREELGNSWEADRRRSTRLSALDARFRAALHGVLSDHLPGLTSAVRRLNEAATELPAQVAHNLVGPDSSLRAAIRSRLRLALLAETAAFWFPYRSLLAVLNLTHGAWDRVLMSLSGSLPSLVGAIWAGAENTARHRGMEEEIREGLHRRGAAAVTDRLGPLAARFRDELAHLRRGRATPAAGEDDDGRSHLAYLAGLDSLQESSQRIFDEEIGRVAVSRGAAVLSGLVGTLLFWGLMAGPVVALYRGHFDASYDTLRRLGGELDAFPTPNAAMLLTSLLLSLLPTAIFAMFVIAAAQSRRRVDRAESRTRLAHDEAIQRLREEGVLRLRWDDPLLSDAEFLLSAGAAESTEPSA